MNILKPALTLAFLLGALLSPDAWAQRGHGGGGHGHFQGGGHSHFHGGTVSGHGYRRGHGYLRGGVIVGAPLYWPGYGYGYRDPYYDYAPGYPVGAAWYLPPGDATVYAGTGTRRLYYCDNPRGYYPNVDACLVPWRPVTATVVPPP